MKTKVKQDRNNRIRQADRVFTGLEPLEGRTMMAAHPAIGLGSFPGTAANFYVTNTAPSGAGSLSAAITAADNANWAFSSVNITFNLPGGSTIAEPGNYALPPITRNNVNIDASNLSGGININGQGSGILAMYIDGASGCTFKGLNIENFNTAFADYGGSYNVFTQDSTSACSTGIGLYLQSNDNTVTGCGFYNSGQDAIYVGGQYNNIGLSSSSQNLISRSSGNGIELSNSNNSVVNNFVHGCTKDCLVLDSGTSNTYVQGNGFSQGLIAEGEHGMTHGSCIDVKAGANNNIIGQPFGTGGSIAFNRITYADLGATPGSYAITVQGTGNQINGDRVILNDGSNPTTGTQDLNIGPGNTFQSSQ